MIEKIEAHDALNERAHTEDVASKVETYGLKSTHCPKQIPELDAFEGDLIKLAENIKFRKSTRNFQKRMKEDIKNIRKSDKTLTPADKTSNMYRLTKEQYNQVKRSAITSTYKKASIKIK